MRILRMVLAIVLVVIGVVSTFGSGGGGGLGLNISYPSPDVPPNITPIENTSMDITAANAQDVAATAVQAHDHALHVAAIIGGQVFPAFPVRRICYQATANMNSSTQRQQPENL